MKIGKASIITATIIGLFCLSFMISACCKTKYVYVTKHSLAEYRNNDFSKLKEFLDDTPIERKVNVVYYHSSGPFNHWIVTTDSIGQVLFLSQLGHYFFYADYGEEKSVVSIGDSLRVSLYKYRKYPEGFSAFRLDGHRGFIGDYMIKSEDGWVENVYYCPDITIVNETIYRIENWK